MDWPEHLPIQLCIGLQLGGGRGVAAKTDLKPGQVVLVESPLVTVPDDKDPEVILLVALK